MRTPRAQHEDEERATDEGRNYAEWHFAGGVDHASAQVGEYQKRSAAHERDWQYDSVARVCREAHQVRDNDAHESDEAAHRDGRSCTQSRRRHDDEANPIRIDSQRECFFFTETKNIE